MSRRVAFYHPLIAFDEQGVSLGIVWETTWTRDELSKASPLEKLKKRRKTPFAHKESYRWMERLQAAQRTAEACPDTNCVCVGDSESDIYELFAAATRSPTPNLNLLIRTIRAKPCS